MVDRLRLHLSEDVMDGRYGSVPFFDDLGEMHSQRLAFWVKEVQQCVAEKRLVSVTLQELRSLYKRADRGGVFPLGLGRVLAELERNKTVAKMSNFQTRRSSVIGSIASAVLSPLRWAMGSGTPVLEEPNVDEVFVFGSLVSETARRVLTELEGQTCFSEEDARSCVRKFVDSDRDVLLVMDWLTNRAGVLEHVEHQKLALMKRATQTVTDLDVTIYELRKAVLRLQQQENELSSQVQKLREQARDAIVTDKNKVKALALLRRKKVFEEALHRRLDMGTNVALILSKVEELQASHDALAALKMGTEAMKASKVNAEQVQELLDEFAELEAEQNQVGTVMADAAKSDFDMDELEIELEKLSFAGENNSPIPELPSAPTRIPGEETVAVAAAPVAKKALVME